MKKILFYTALLFMANLCFAQAEPPVNSTNTRCANASSICGSPDIFQEGDNRFNFSWQLPTQNGDCPTSSGVYYSFSFNSNGVFYLDLANTTADYIWYGPMNGNIVEACELVNSYNVTMENGSANSNSSTALNYQSGTYVLQILPDDCSGSGSFRGKQFGEHIECTDSLPCTDCITSFQPSPGRYVISAWVKEADAPQSTTTYTNASIGVSFQNSQSTYTFTPSGRIIDGWQRVEGELIIPNSAQSIEITLDVSQGDAFFDDIRFFPFDGSMMSYVYDPISLRLMAELDERNYATFYEYDEEGKLIRVKKETEKGVMTIQENRDNITK